MENPKRSGYSFSWTQPYEIPAMFVGKTPGEVFLSLTIEEHLSKMDMIDRWIDAMLTYPDAEDIMNKLRQQRSEK